MKAVNDKRLQFTQEFGKYSNLSSEEAYLVKITVIWNGQNTNSLEGENTQVTKTWILQLMHRR